MNLVLVRDCALEERPGDPRFEAINELFKGFRVSLGGIEVPVELQEGPIISYTPCEGVSHKRPGEGNTSLQIDCRFVAAQEVRPFYMFNRDALIEPAVQCLKGALRGRPDKQKIYQSLGLEDRYIVELYLAGISRPHFAIYVHPGFGTHITDVGSTAGTWVNGEKLGNTIDDCTGMRAAVDEVKELCRTGRAEDLVRITHNSGKEYDDERLASVRDELGRIVNQGLAKLNHRDKIVLGKQGYGTRYSFVFMKHADF